MWSLLSQGRLEAGLVIAQGPAHAAQRPTRVTNGEPSTESRHFDANPALRATKPKSKDAGGTDYAKEGWSNPRRRG